MKKKTGDLYRLIFADGKSYIGASIDGAEKRYQAHRRATMNGGSRLVNKAWRRYGPPKLVILARGLATSTLWKAEREAIFQYDTLNPKGYNYRSGSKVPPSMFGKQHTVETRQRQSQSHLGLLSGVSHTAEHRKNNSLARIGIPHTEEHKENNRQAQLRRYQDPKECEKLSVAQRKRHHDHPVSDSTRKKRSASLLEWHKHNIVSAMTREKQSQAHSGVKMSSKTKENMRIASLKREAQKRRERKRKGRDANLAI